MVVPELDDSFPEDFDNSNKNNKNNNSSQDYPPPIVGEDYFSGAEDFQLDGIPPSSPDFDYFQGNSGYDSTRQNKEAVVNPFPFPQPNFSFTEERGTKNTLARNENKFEATAPFSVPEPIATELQDTITSGLDDAIQKSKDGDFDDTITRLTKDEFKGMEQNTNDNDPSIIATTDSLSNSMPVPMNESGRRTMTTMANDSKDDPQSNSNSNAEKEPEPTQENDLWQPLNLEQPSIVTEPVDQAAFAPFASIMEDPGPVKPLVAPLKLSSPSDAATKTASMSDTSTVPTIEANGLDDLVDSLQGQLKSAQREIEVMAGDKAKSINLNSPKQVSQLLFGQPDMSTNKSTLEGMAANNILAKLVLEYREAKRRLNKVLKQQELRNAGTDGASSDAETTSPSLSPPSRPMKDPVLLFDTSSFIFRAYYSNPPIHRARDGMPTGAVMGFCAMLNKLLLTSMLNGETPILVHCLDAPGPSFRKELYPDYKAHRPPIPLDLVPQFNLISRAVKAYGMIQIQATGFEADDVIATLATIGSQTEGLDIKILSGDKDLMQLVTEYDANDDADDDDDASGSSGMVHMVDPMTSKVWNHEMVMEKWGVKSSQLGDVLALAGDAADNVPGVPGIGPKIAAQLLQEFGTLESLLENTDQIPQPKRREKLETNADSARISRELVELKRGLEWSQMEAFHPSTEQDADEPTPTPMLESTKISELRMQPIQPDRILAFYDDMGFHKLKTQLLNRLETVQPGGQSGSEESSPPTQAKPSSKTAAAPTAQAKPKARPKRSYWEKTKRGVPKPEEFNDVPFWIDCFFWGKYWHQWIDRVQIV